jgi:hypothetical protein
MQNTAAFTWSVTYQFEGEEKKQRKGTVLLMH